MLAHTTEVDVIVTATLIPGRKAPVLVNQEMLDAMRPGSVLVDLATVNGGNVAQTEANKVIMTENGMTIIGYTDLPSRLASMSSTLVSAQFFVGSTRQDTATRTGARGAERPSNAQTSRPARSSSEVEGSSSEVLLGAHCPV